MKIEVEGISKAFAEYPALENISVAIPSGELVALLGPSGSGKTTLLRLIAGIEEADAGCIRFDGIDVTKRPIQDRKVGFVFQDYALFDHMTVADNIAFGLSVRKTAKGIIEARVRDLIARVQLDGLSGRYPQQLSGGQRQRVALARALAPDPVMLLLDEPFGALDARVRAELRTWLRRLHDDLHLTSVFVTHDQEEALEVADQIVVMNVGKIEQIGAPDAVFDEPSSAFVMDFLGGANVLRGRVSGTEGVFGEVVLPWKGPGEGAARAYIRDHDLILRKKAGEGPSYRGSAGTRDEDAVVGPCLPVVVERIRRVGVAARVLVTSVEHGELTAEMPHRELATHGVERGAKLIAHVRSARIFIRTEAA